jgi:ACS family D-galactonate transporter-like MFS transporter
MTRRIDAMTTEAIEAVNAVKPTRARLLILSLITAGTMINYLDRTVISVAAPLLSSELGLDAALMGIAFSAFSWTYAAAQIPGGILLDRFGVRLTYYWSVTLWSLCTVLQGLTGGLGTLVGARLALGVAEAPAYPCNSRILSIWFPQAERARATGVYAVGQYFGLAFLSPVLFWLAGNFGWRALFVIVGIVGIVFGVVWWAAYRDPSQSRRANAQELRYIEAGGGLSTSARATHFEWRHIRFLLSKRQIVGASIGQFASNSTLVFFLTWFPTYLATERHMAWLKIGFFAVLPFIAASVGVVAGGILSDWLLLRTQSANLARKLPIVAGLALASAIVSANFLDNDATVIAVMSVAFFGQGMCNLGWTLITDVAPRQLIGLTGGVFNLCANLAGIVTPLVVGFVVATTGSFAWALGFIAVVAVIGALSYIFVLGDVKRVEYEA